MAEEFKPGDRVLADFPGYGYWPSVVFGVEQLTTKVYKIFQKKKKLGPQWIPVCFFQDHSYASMASTKVKILTEEMIEKYLAKPTGSDDMTEAYEEAQAYTTQQEFVEELTNDKWVPADSIYPDTQDETVSRKGKKPGPKPKISKRSTSDDIQEQPKTASVGRATKKQRKASEPPQEPKIEEEDEEQLKHKVHLFRYKLQKGLIQRTDQPTESELKECSKVLREVEDFNPKMTLDLLRYSKLHKVVRAILKTGTLERPNDLKFHERCSKLLIEWEDYIHTLKNEKERHRTDTPNTSVLDNINSSIKHEESPATNGESKQEDVEMKDANDDQEDKEKVEKNEFENVLKDSNSAEIKEENGALSKDEESFKPDESKVTETSVEGKKDVLNNETETSEKEVKEENGDAFLRSEKTEESTGNINGETTNGDKKESNGDDKDTNGDVKSSIESDRVKINAEEAGSSIV